METPIDLEMVSASAGQAVQLGVVSAPERRQGEAWGHSGGQAGGVLGVGGTAESPLVSLSHCPDIWGDLQVDLGQREGKHLLTHFSH